MTKPNSSLGEEKRQTSRGTVLHVDGSSGEIEHRGLDRKDHEQESTLGKASKKSRLSKTRLSNSASMPSREASENKFETAMGCT
jgi:hypothetical protein